MPKRKSKLNFKFTIAIVIILMSIIFFLVALNLDSFLILQKQEIPVSVRISNYTAINITKDSDILSLGTVKKGTSAGPRNISIENSRNFPTIVEIEIKGDIAPLLIFDKVIYLEAKENREFSISTKFIEDEKFGDYSGILIIKFKKNPS